MIGERKGNAEQKPARVLPQPLHRKQRQQFVAGGKGFQVMIEVNCRREPTSTVVQKVSSNNTSGRP